MRHLCLKIFEDKRALMLVYYLQYMEVTFASPRCVYLNLLLLIHLHSMCLKLQFFVEFGNLPYNTLLVILKIHDL